MLLSAVRYTLPPGLITGIIQKLWVPEDSRCLQEVLGSLIWWLKGSHQWICAPSSSISSLGTMSLSNWYFHTLSQDDCIILLVDVLGVIYTLIQTWSSSLLSHPSQSQIFYHVIEELSNLPTQKPAWDFHFTDYRNLQCVRTFMPLFGNPLASASELPLYNLYFSFVATKSRFKDK